MFILISVTVLALIFGAILGFASIKLKVEADPIVEKIDAILPQSQCGQCGYPGCKPYAEAIANGDVITKCVPGGRPTVVKIAEIMGVDVPAMDDVAEPEKWLLLLMKICVLAVPNVFKPALLMPLLVQTKPCILLFPISVQAVNFASHLVQQIVFP